MNSQNFYYIHSDTKHPIAVIENPQYDRWLASWDNGKKREDDVPDPLIFYLSHLLKWQELLKVIQVKERL